MIDILERYEQEKRVAEYYAAIGQVMRRTWKYEKLETYLSMFVEQVSKLFDWQLTAIFVKHGNRMDLRSSRYKGKPGETGVVIELDQYQRSSDVILDVIRTQEEQRNSKRLITCPQLHPTEGSIQYLAYPLINREVLFGVLLLGRIEGEFDDCETEVLRDLAEHIALAMDNIKLYEAKERYMIAEERSRLAKDLHDSVNQKLFSMSLIAQGLEDSLQHDHRVITGLREIGQLAHESLAEMKSLIWDLRTDSDDQSLGAKIKDYASKIGLDVQVSIDDQLTFATTTQEVFWRICQEALNNVRKHARTNEATVLIREDGRHHIQMQIIDRGCGFQVEAQQNRSSCSFGLRNMRERIGALDGTLRIISAEGQGTTIHITAPAGGS